MLHYYSHIDKAKTYQFTYLQKHPNSSDSFQLHSAIPNDSLVQKNSLSFDYTFSSSTQINYDSAFVIVGNNRAGTLYLSSISSKDISISDSFTIQKFLYSVYDSSLLKSYIDTNGSNQPGKIALFLHNYSNYIYISNNAKWLYIPAYVYKDRDQLGISRTTSLINASHTDVWRLPIDKNGKLGKPELFIGGNKILNVFNSNYTNQQTAIVHSPNDSFAYATWFIKEKDRNFRGQLVQIDLYHKDTVILFDSLQSAIWGFTYGPDGAIYYSCNKGGITDSLHTGLNPIINYDSHYLGRIAFPNKKGKKCLAQTEYFASGSFYKKNLYPTGLIVSNIAYAPYPYMPEFNMFEACNSSDYQIVLKNQSPKEYQSFTWYVYDADSNEIFTSNAYDTKVNLPQPGIYYVALEGYFADGQKYKKWDYKYFSFNKKLNAFFSIQDSTACQWTSLQLIDATQQDTATQNKSEWLIRLNNKLLATSSDSVFNYELTNYGKLKISLVHSNGFCTDTFTSDKIIDIKEAPKPIFQLSDTIICQNQIVHLKETATGNISNREYIWSDGFSTQNPNHSRIVNKTGWYQISQKLSSPSACTSQSTQRLRVRKGAATNSLAFLQSTEVLDSQRIKIQWDSIGYVQGYQLQNQLNQKTSYSNSPLQNHLIDTVPNTHLTSYQYSLKAIDSCGDEIAYLNHINSIVLKAKNQNNQLISHSWNHFEQWQGGVDYYELQRRSNNINWQSIYSSQQSQFEDASEELSLNDSVQYRLIAHSKLGWQSISNRVSVPLGNTLFIPNAFSPNNDCVNDDFKIGLYGITEIECSIYAPNGQIVAQSSDPNWFWDGKIKGEYAPSGMYLYVITAKTSNAQTIEHKGQLRLIR